MTLLKRFGFFLLVSGLALAQTNSPNSAQSSTNSIADDLKALRESIAQQQQQIAEQQKRIDALKKGLGQKNSVSPHIIDASLRTSASSTSASSAAAVQPVSDAPPQEQPKASPLSFRIGAAEFTPGGFVDFENIFRTTNTGNVAATNFGAIPYSNTVQ